jgi:hypothetical protein
VAVNFDAGPFMSRDECLAAAARAIADGCARQALLSPHRAAGEAYQQGGPSVGPSVGWVAASLIAVGTARPFPKTAIRASETRRDLRPGRWRGCCGRPHHIDSHPRAPT